MSSALSHALVRVLPHFGSMADDKLDDLLHLAKLHRLGVGSRVFEQGVLASQFYLLLNGNLRLSQVTSAGQQVIVRMIGSGELFGITPALNRPDYPGTAIAIVESLALAWPMAEWDRLMQAHPALAITAIRTVGQRLQEAQDRILEMATQEVERRVAHTVLRLGNQSGKREAAGIRIEYPVSKQDIAEMTGTTLHTVSRILTAWEAAGLVEGGRQKLLIREPHKLLLIADGLTPGLQ